MFLTFNILNNGEINYNDLGNAFNSFTAKNNKSPDAIIVGYKTYKWLNKDIIKTIWGLDILVDFSIEDMSCNLCFRI